MAVRKGYWCVSYELPDPLYEELRKIAKEKKSSVSEIVRHLIEKDLSEKNNELEKALGRGN